MLFEKLTAFSFGPFKDESLEFAPGFNVIYGPNEAGKSTWHAGLFAGLCGFQKGHGGRQDFEAFRTKHRPWDGEEWKVTIVLKLQDNRRVWLSRDLDNGTGIAADVELGRDYTNEIIRHKAPDGAIWLGLSRDVFSGIACVRQAQILEVLENPERIQEYLQRAADTFGADATAAQALAVIEKFQKRNVGTPRAATKPLGQAYSKLRRAQDLLEEARAIRSEYDDLVTRTVRVRLELAGVSRKRKLWEAALAGKEASRAAERYERAAELIQRYPQPPSSLSGAEQKLQRVAGAIQAWRDRPPDPEYPPVPPEELEKKLAELESMGEGDLDPDPELEQIFQQYLSVKQRLEDYDSNRPHEVKRPQLKERTSPDELKDLGRVLATPKPEVDPSLEKEIESVNSTIDRLQSLKVRNKFFLLGAGLLVSIGLVLLALQFTWLGVTTAILGLIVAGASLLGNPQSRIVDLLLDLKSLEDKMGEMRLHLANFQKEREKALRRLEELGIQENEDTLQHLAGQLDTYERYREHKEQWENQRQERVRELESASRQLRSRLKEKGIEPSDDLENSLQVYREACQIRRKRKELEAQLETARKEKQRAAEAARRLEQIHSQLGKVAKECGICAGDPESITAQLEDWRRQFQEQTRAHEKALVEYSELQSLLRQGSLEDLQNGRDVLKVRAESLASEFTLEEVNNVDLQEAEAGLESLRTKENTLENTLTRVATELSALERSVPSVAECEEAVAAAEAEVAYIESLAKTLEHTRQFLQEAEAEMHRTIAPKLAEIVRNWLPAISAGRYTDARVDPENLAVSVRAQNGEWLDAIVLSHGTAEQIYLLLRIALAECLTRRGESCPLILDDVTVQSDVNRTREILEMLEVLSQDRQIIFFTQENEVLDWAKDNLQGANHRIIKLAMVPIR